MVFVEFKSNCHRSGLDDGESKGVFDIVARLEDLYLDKSQTTSTYCNGEDINIDPVVTDYFINVKDPNCTYEVTKAEFNRIKGLMLASNASNDIAVDRVDVESNLDGIEV